MEKKHSVADRLPNWEKRVQEVYEDYRDKRFFEWGKSDCIQMAAEVQMACYGKMYCNDFHKTYSCLRSGNFLLSSKFTSVREAMDNYFCQQIALSDAKFGDIALTMDPKWRQPVAQLVLDNRRRVTFVKSGMIDSSQIPVHAVWMV